jgi:hypothetical protein
MVPGQRVRASASEHEQVLRLVDVTQLDAAARETGQGQCFAFLAVDTESF